MTLAISPSLTDAFAQIIRGLFEVVEAHRANRVMELSIVTLLCSRFRTLQTEFNRIVTQLRDGTFPKPRVRPADAPARAPSSRLGAPRPPSPLVTDFPGWLNQMLTVDRHVAGMSAIRLEYLLKDPELPTLLEAAPQRVGRILRSLCWMLNVDHNGVLPPRPSRRRRSGDSEAEAPQAARPTRLYRRKPRLVPPPAPPVPTVLELPDGRQIDLKTIPEAGRLEFIRWALKPWTG